jgi:uncharacterized membrane protein YfcA
MASLLRLRTLLTLSAIVFIVVLLLVARTHRHSGPSQPTPDKIAVAVPADPSPEARPAPPAGRSRLQSAPLAAVLGFGSSTFHVGRRKSSLPAMRYAMRRNVRLLR